MPIHEIKVNEYECLHCGHKWINRTNYKDGPVPKNCAKCKRQTWNMYRITPKENGLRKIVRGFRDLYNDHDKYQLKGKASRINWPADLCEQFLAIEPRPTIYELNDIVYSSPLKRFNNGEAIYRTRNWVPDPKVPGGFRRDPSIYEPISDRPGYVKRKHNLDPKFVSDYDKLVIKEAEIRKKLMIDIMKDRGINYKPDPIYTAAYEKALAKADKELKELVRGMSSDLNKRE